MAYSLKPVRRTQLISPWGVGAIVPFPEDESLMIAGLDMWQFGREKSEFIVKDERLEKRLGVRELRRPPDFRDCKSDKSNHSIRIPAVRFPRWQYCPFCGTMSKSSYYSAQEECIGYEWPHGRSCTGKKYKRKLIPERFIVVCPEGHIDDFPLMEWVHYNNDNPNHPFPVKDSCVLRRSTGGMSASLSSVKYECSCGAKRSMAGATNSGALERIGYCCRGSKPWLGIEKDDEQPCSSQGLKVVQRGGTNIWFADIRSSIYIPIDTEDTSRRIKSVLDEFFDMVNAQRVNGELNKTFIELLAKSKKIDYQALYDATVKRIEKIDDTYEVTEDISEEEYRLAEYRMLVKSSGGDKLEFHSKNYSIQQYDREIHKYLKSISLVPKLRETRAFIGFSRLQPDYSMSIADKKKMIRLSEDDWLPAVEVYGEGIFFEFDENALQQWSELSEVRARVAKLNASFQAMNRRQNNSVAKLNANFVLIHTFAHLLINQLSYECGYGSSSIRERIYCDKSESDIQMYGALLYTASGDSEGSLGGLVRQGQAGRIEDTIVAAIRNAQWCSSDPICIQSLGQGPDSCNFAACHNCALLPETCCETGNRLLDRALVVGTLDKPSIGFFSGLGDTRNI
jgi:hypothetical protein